MLGIKLKPYLVINVRGPKPCRGTIIGIEGENRARLCANDPNLIDVLDDHNRLADRPVVVNEHRDQLIHGVRANKKLTLRSGRLIDKFGSHILQVQCNLNPHGEKA